MKTDTNAACVAGVSTAVVFSEKNSAYADGASEIASEAGEKEARFTPEVLSEAGNFLCELMENGVAFSNADGKLTFRSPVKLSDEERKQLAEFREAIRYILGRSESLPSCPKCAGRIVEAATFDGFLNFLCPPCNRSYGCVPFTPEAIARFGDRGFEVVEALRVQSGRSRLPDFEALNKEVPAASSQLRSDERRSC